MTSVPYVAKPFLSRSSRRGSFLRVSSCCDRSCPEGAQPPREASSFAKPSDFAKATTDKMADMAGSITQRKCVI